MKQQLTRGQMQRASEIVQLAQIIKEEEGVDDNTAYIEAERLVDDVRHVTEVWSEHQPVVPVGTLRVIPLAWGLVLRRGGAFFVVRPDEVATVEGYAQGWQMRRK